MGIRACQQSWIIRSRCWIAHVKERATPGRNYACAESSQLQAAPANLQADRSHVFPYYLEDDWKSLGSRADHPTQGTDSSGGVPGLVNTALWASSSHSEVETASQSPM